MLTTYNYNATDWFDLQHLADAGTVVNTTTGTVNAYTGTPTTSDKMSATMKTYYDTELLENARAQYFYAQFGRKQALPAHHGRTVEWRKFDTLPNADVLTEGVIPEGKTLGMSHITVPITQYGMYVAITDVLDLHALDNIKQEAVEELGASLGNTQDILARDTLMTGTNVMYADIVDEDGTVTPVTSRATLTENAKLTPRVINKAVTALKKAKAPTINGKYVAIVHPSVVEDLRNSSEWLEAHKYAAPGEIFNGEIGQLHGVRFIESVNAKVVEGGADDGVVYQTIVLGKDAYGIIDPEGGAAEMIIKSAAEIGGPLQQFGTCGYKTESALKILYEDRMIRIESGSSYSNVDEAN